MSVAHGLARCQHGRERLRRQAVELDDRSQPIDILPQTVTAGTTVELDDRFEITVDTITVRDSYSYRTAGGETGTRATAAGSGFVFGRVRVVNLGDSVRSAPSRSEFAGSTTDGFSPVYFGRESWSEIQFGGHPYPISRRLEPAEAVDGWVLLTGASGAHPEGAASDGETATPRPEPDGSSPGAATAATPVTGTVGIAWNRDFVTSPLEVLWRPAPG